MTNQPGSVEGGDAEGDDEEWTGPEVKEIATRLLARRGHAASELRRKLEERDVPAPMAADVCDELADAGCLDDVEFARHQGTILRDKQWGPAQIRRKLRDRGIDDAVIDTVLAEIGGPEVWLRHCWERLCDRFGPDPESFSQRDKQKAYRHLTHRGFQPSTVRQILFDGVRPDNTSEQMSE